MALPEPLNDAIQSARAMTSRANAFEDHLVHNSKVILDNAKAWVRPDEAIDIAFQAATLHLEDFRSELSGGHSLSERGKASVENARQLALIALDKLEVALADARPSQTADALGHGWL